MLSARFSSMRARVSPLAFAAATVLSLSMMGASQAHAAFVGFCEGAKLGPGGSCEYPTFTTTLRVFGEQIGSGEGAEICVAINEPGGVRVGKRCGFERAISQEGVGTNNGKAWIHNNSSKATITVTGFFEN